jgi:hypothetical protein
VDRFAVFYACMIDDDDAGIFVDYPFFGGIASSEEEVNQLMRSLTNDRNLPGAVIPKKYRINNMADVLEVAKRQFKQLTKDVYAMEDMQARMKNKK